MKSIFTVLAALFFALGPISAMAADCPCYNKNQECNCEVNCDCEAGECDCEGSGCDCDCEECHKS